MIGGPERRPPDVYCSDLLASPKASSPGVQSTGFSRVVFLESSKRKSRARVNTLTVRYYYPAKAGTLNARWSDHAVLGTPPIFHRGFISRVVFLNQAIGKSRAKVITLIIRYYYPAEAGTLNARSSDHAVLGTPPIFHRGFISRVVFLNQASGKSRAEVIILIIRYHYPAEAGTLNTRC